ncbi:hypothetical protein F4777DRAFT_340427 [Nemania sp. FL0916]|nr:hypothetical protein F4777DRAFT_340427 [Nemania sp. FL0916]
MGSHGGSSPSPEHHDGNRIGGRGRLRTLSRSLHLGSQHGTPHARSDSVGSLGRIFDTEGPDQPPVPIARGPILTSDERACIEKTHGFSETRDGFFDAFFLAPEDVNNEALLKHAEETLPLAFRKRDPLSLAHFFPRQCHEAWTVVCRVLTTRSGIKLLKSFLGFFIAYVLCLIPTVRSIFGHYAYIMAISAILNHPGRTLGAQVDGAVLTTLGTASGLGWGAFGLWASTITASARIGFGAILALFLFLHMFAIACLRSYYIRTHQLVICAGIAISYACLAEISGPEISWLKLLAYGIPWLVGQAISLVVCIILAPDAGSRPLAVGMHQIFGVMVDGIPPIHASVRTRRRLAQAFVAMSQVYRDLALDLSITVISPKDTLTLRKTVQSVIRALLSLSSDSNLFESARDDLPSQNDSPRQDSNEFVVRMGKSQGVSSHANDTDIIEFVTRGLATPTQDLLRSMKSALESCDAALMDMCGHRRYLGPPSTTSSDTRDALTSLRGHITAFNTKQDQLLGSDKLAHAYSKCPSILEIFASCRSIHQAAACIEILVAQLVELQKKQPKYPHFHLPRYPLRKAIYRTNAQVRHDRGGVTAGMYFRSLEDIGTLIKKIRSRDFRPVSQKEALVDDDYDDSIDTIPADNLSNNPKSRRALFRHRAWALLHRLQGFETRFGLKTALVTSLLAIPAYLTNSQAWWDRYEGWWGVVMGWLIMGPRTGGNVQDLLTRLICAILGALWAGLACAAGNGNPYIIAAFAAIFMLPMMYRYTQSTHPRSGMVGCISFTVISLSEISVSDASLLGIPILISETSEGVQPSIAKTAATRGAVMIFGVIASILVNWVLWPFVARHDLRKGLASMLFNCSIVYRSTISQYVYYEQGNPPTKRDIEASEILEGLLREGFVRLRQLLALTRHEIRLRATFDPLPYSALISSCEQFFDHIITLRQSSLCYRPHSIGDESDIAINLISYRRDEIATVLTNMYVLAGALRADRRIPRYLPNAAVTRKRLLDRMHQLEKEHAVSGRYNEEKRRESILEQISSYSYNDSLTGCVEQLKQLEKYTKIIVGEQ